MMCPVHEFVLTNLMVCTGGVGNRWYAKRFMHPDIVDQYNYIFLWDEDLGVEHFHAEK